MMIDELRGRQEDKGKREPKSRSMWSGGRH